MTTLNIFIHIPPTAFPYYYRAAPSSASSPCLQCLLHLSPAPMPCWLSWRSSSFPLPTRGRKTERRVCDDRAGHLLDNNAGYNGSKSCTKICVNYPTPHTHTHQKQKGIQRRQQWYLNMRVEFFGIVMCCCCCCCFSSWNRQKIRNEMQRYTTWWGTGM